MSSRASTEVVHTYRHLYRALLRAVQYSKPNRYVARDQLRDAFRKEKPDTCDQTKVSRTLQFLENAARETGLEHRLVKTLLHTRYWETREEHFLWVSTSRCKERGSARRPLTLSRMSKVRTPIQMEVRRTARIHYNMTLAMLNDSMGLCLR